VISVGRRNRFGHPSPQTLSALAACGAHVWRTDRDGAVTITTDGQTLEVEAQAHLSDGRGSQVAAQGNR
jgi:competence protein ComEC